MIQNNTLGVNRVVNIMVTAGAMNLLGLITYGAYGLYLQIIAAVSTRI